MNTNLMKHAKLIIRVKNNGLDADLINIFPINKIIDCCSRIENTKILKNDYMENRILQEELVRDENFILY